MKKVLSSILVCVMLLGCVFALASCAKSLTGTYEAEESGVKLSYTFDGDSVTTKVAMGGLSYEFEGTYAIEDDTITFTYEEDNSVMGMFDIEGDMSFNQGSDSDGSYIELDGTKFYKK